MMMICHRLKFIFCVLSFLNFYNGSDIRRELQISIFWTRSHFWRMHSFFVLTSNQSGQTANEYDFQESSIHFWSGIDGVVGDRLSGGVTRWQPGWMPPCHQSLKLLKNLFFLNEHSLCNIYSNISKHYYILKRKTSLWKKYSNIPIH